MLIRWPPLLAVTLKKLIKMCFMGPVGLMEISRINWNANSLATGSDVTLNSYPFI